MENLEKVLTEIRKTVLRYSEIVALKDSTSPSKISSSTHEKMTFMPNGIQYFLMACKMASIKVLGGNTSDRSWLKFFFDVVSCFPNGSDRKNKSNVSHMTTVC